MELGLRAVLSQEVLEYRYRTREGTKTVGKHGRVPGGICYGYRVRREFDDNGEPVLGLRSIDTDEAATIVWIFERYADGMSPVRIANEFTARGVPGPRDLGKEPQFAVIVTVAPHSEQSGLYWTDRLQPPRLSEKSRDRPSALKGERGRAPCRAGGAVA